MSVKADCEEITPYEEEAGKTGQVRRMFDSIAPAYDLMNRAMTMGIDKWWRRVAVGMLEGRNPRDILDVATGTGDLAIALARRLDPATVTGIDLSERMIEIGRRKVAQSGLGDVVKLLEGDCLSLPFTDESFDVVTVAYGVRNFENLLKGYSEMYRVLRPGGMVLVVELSRPESRLIRPMYDFYSGRVIPAVGRIVSRDGGAYTYLPKSIAAVPQGEEMLALMGEAGFAERRCRKLTLGTCSIYTGVKC